MEGVLTMRRTLGMIGMILAVLGVVLCLGATIGSWYARGVVNTSMHELVPAVDTALGDASALLARVDAVRDNANDTITSARTRIRSLVENNAGSVAAVTDNVNNVVTSIATPIREVRDQLATLRASIFLFTTFFNGLPSFFGLPDIPTDRLVAIDERARAVDEQVETIVTAVETTEENIATTRANITEALDTLQNHLESLSNIAETLSNEMASLRRSLPVIEARVNLLLTSGALFMTLLALCGAALFVNLFYDAHRQWDEGNAGWVRVHTTSTATETTTKKVNGGEVVTTVVTVTESKGRELAAA